MFFLFKVFQQIILPSVFLFFSFLLSFFLLLKKRKEGRYLLFASIVSYYLFSITPFSDLLICPLEKGYQKTIFQKDIPFIVVLSGGIRNQPEKDINSLTESSQKRALKAFEIYQKSFPKPKIIVSGSFSSFENEAQKIGEFLISLGVKKDDILIEKNSKNTFQSAKKVKEIVREKKFFLVSSAFHLKRADFLFKKEGLEPILVGSDFRCEKNYDFFDFLPKPSNLKKSNLAFHEYLGLVFYNLFF